MSEIVFQHDIRKPNEAKIEVANYPVRIGSFLRNGPVIYIIDSDPENRGSSTTILATDNKNANELIGARSTISLLGMSNLQPKVGTAKGICKVEQ